MTGPSYFIVYKSFQLVFRTNGFWKLAQSNTDGDPFTKLKTDASATRIEIKINCANCPCWAKLNDEIPCIYCKSDSDTQNSLKIITDKMKSVWCWQKSGQSTLSNSWEVKRCQLQRRKSWFNRWIECILRKMRLFWIPRLIFVLQRRIAASSFFISTILRDLNASSLAIHICSVSRYICLILKRSISRMIVLWILDKTSDAINERDINRIVKADEINENPD